MPENHKKQTRQKPRSSRSSHKRTASLPASLRAISWTLPVVLCALCVSSEAGGENSPKGQKAKAPKTVKAVPARTAPAPAPVVEPVTITARAQVEVPGRTFTLGEIAEIAGKDAELVAKLRDIEIGTSPLPGQSRQLFPGDITVKLRANRLDDKRVAMTAPPLMRITRAKNEVATDALSKVALEAAQDVLQDFPGAKLEPEPLSENIALPKGKVEMLPGAYRGRPESGTIRVPISLIVDGKPFQIVEVPVKVRRKKRVLIANRPLEPNEILTADDVSLALIDLPPGFTRPILKSREAIGKRVRRRILAESPISAAVLETPPAVNLNDKVSIEYRVGPVTITADLVARQAGAVGDTIRAYSEDTKKMLDVVIVNSHTVRLPESARAESEPASAEPEEEENE